MVYHRVVLVLRGVSLTVPQGAIVALLGPNGAGKTTTLRAITGLLDIHDGAISRGVIRLGEEDLRSRRADAIVGMGVAQVMEGRRVLAELTVEENLMAGTWGVSGADARQRLAQSYEEFPILGDRRRQQAGYLSGGEQQMVAIARALMASPKLLLMDEPSLGLAPKIVAQLAGIIARINERGVGVLLVEQNAAMALDLASHGYVLETGKVVHDGPSDELKADDDIREFYLGTGGDGSHGYRDVKHYRRRKRWLS